MSTKVTAEITNNTVIVGSGQSAWVGKVVHIADYTFILHDNGKIYELCGRCDSRIGDDGTISATGFIRAYGHVFGGICFGCNGTGITKSIPSVEVAEKRVTSRLAGRIARDRAKAREIEAKRAVGETWKTNNSDLALFFGDVLADAYDGVEYGPVREFAYMVNRGEALTDGQTKYARKCMEIMGERRAKRIQREAEISTYTYVGEIDEKITATGKIITAFLTEPNDYGKCSMIVVIDTGSHFVKMTTTALWAWDVEKGDEITVIGTVKAHKEWNGMPQTILKRPKRV